MPSPAKTDDVHKQIAKLQKQREHLQMQIDLITNDKQKKIKRNKRRKLKRKIKRLINSLPGLKKISNRKVYVEEPESDMDTEEEDME